MPVLDRPVLARSGRVSGFAVVEIVVVAAVAVVVAALVCVAGDRARRSARLGDDIGNLRQIGAMTGAYAGDNAGVFWTFSWQGSPEKPSNYSKWNDLNGDTTNMAAAASQAVDLLYRLAGRTDIPKIGQWLPHAFYSHLVLLEYQHPQAQLPSRTFISSGDVNRLSWATDPVGFDRGKFGTQQPFPSSANKRWPYSSSYHVDSSVYDRSGVGNRVHQSATHAQYQVPAAADLGGRIVADTAFPSRKVHIHDGYAWHFGRYGPKSALPYFAHAAARLPYLFVDGSVDVHRTTSGNRGWQPNSPDTPEPTSYVHQPDTWDPPTVSGEKSEPVVGHVRWTRGFMGGRDFGGGEPGMP